MTLIQPNMPASINIDTESPFPKWIKERFLDRGVNVKDAGAIGDDTTDDTQAFLNVISELESKGGGCIDLPDGTYKITSDLIITSGNIKIRGLGNKSIIHLVDCQIKIDAVAAGEHIFQTNIENVEIKRTGSIVGSALKINGQNGSGVARWSMSDVHITESTGSGLEISGGWIFDIVRCIFSGCASHGVYIVLAVDGNSSANAARFFGGEIQGNAGYGVYAESTSSLSFFGTSIEGNAGGGVNLANNNRNVGFYNGYFEGNGGAAGDRDIVAGDTSFSSTKATGYCLKIDNCVFWDGAGGKDYAIELSRMTSVSIENSKFVGYSTAAINNNPELTAQVSGYYRNCETNAPTLAVDDIYFKKELSEIIITHDEVYDFPLIANGSSASHAFTINGANIGDFVQVSSGTNLQGLVMSAQVTATDTVTVTLINNTGGDVDMAASTFRFIIIPYTYYV